MPPRPGHVRESPPPGSEQPPETEYSSLERANFGFLDGYDLPLAEFALQAERFCLWDPCASLFKLRLFVERMAKLVAARIFPHWSFREDLFKLLQRLEEYGAFGPEVGRAFHRIRKLANTAVHYGLASREEALGALRLAHGLAIWFARSSGPEPGEELPTFQEPRERNYGFSLLDDQPSDWRVRVTALEEQVRLSREESTELVRLRELASTEAQIAQLRLREAGAAAGEIGAWDLAALAGFAPDTTPQPSPRLDTDLAEAFAFRCRAAEILMAHRSMPRAEARWLIGEELREAGWTIAGGYEDGACPIAELNQVLADWPTYAGPADFVLFCGMTPVAMLALRPELQELAPALETASAWSRGYIFQPGEVPALGAPWSRHRVPWILAANGHDLASGGLLAQDLRNPTLSATPRQRWPKPRDLAS